MSAETLRKAAAIVRERGKACGRHEDAEGRVSAIGALRRAHVGSGWKAIPHVGEYARDYEATRRLLPPVLNGLPPGNLVVWSDRSDTTAQDVARAFESAAARLESQDVAPC